LDVDVIDEGSILFDRVERILLRRGQILAWKEWLSVILHFLFNHFKLVLRVDQNAVSLNDRHALDKNDALPLDFVFHELLDWRDGTLDAGILLILSKRIFLLESIRRFLLWSRRLINLFVNL
jgi:hypothetical protein